MSRALPLVVDMDGTLIATDVLAEGLIAGAFLKPLSTLLALSRLIGGRAPFKRRIAQIDAADIAAVPLRLEVVEWLGIEKAGGRAIHLVTAADESVAQRVADRVGLFDTVQGSRDGINLKSRRKAAALKRRFPAGFVYAGDSRADLAVWQEAAGIVTVGVSPGVARRVRHMRAPVERAFAVPKAGFREWGCALRVQRWANSLLVFVPLVLSGEFRNPALSGAGAAFWALLAAASGMHLLNDLANLGADRRSRSKIAEPLVAGLIPIHSAAIAALALIFGALVTASFSSLALTLSILLYLCLAWFFLRANARSRVGIRALDYGVPLIIGFIVLI